MGWRETQPIAFRLGCWWARNRFRGRGVLPGILYRLFGDNWRFSIRTAKGARLACWPGSLNTYTGIASKGGRYEPFVLQQIVSLLRPEEVLYDVGGNVGIMSIDTIKSFQDEVEVYCFEPQEQLARHIAISAALNGFEHLRVFNCLLDESPGELELHIPSHSIHASLIARGKDVRKEVRMAYMLDTLVADQSISPPDIIKIDVEGAEMRVLTGARQTLSSHSPSIIFEADVNMERFGYTTEELISFMRSCNKYSIYLIDPSTGSSREIPQGAYSQIPRNANMIALAEKHKGRLA